MTICKIKILVDDPDSPDEFVWAEHDSRNLFTIINAPYVAYELAEGDIVECVKEGDIHVVKHLWRDSGNGNLRIIFGDDNEKKQRVLAFLLDRGCTYESANAKYAAVTINPLSSALYDSIIQYLEDVTGDFIQGYEVAKVPMHIS